MQARLAPHAALAGARSCRARASPKQGSSYFSEADPSQGVTQLWGQGKKRDLIREARGLRWQSSPRLSPRRLAAQKEEGELLWCAAAPTCALMALLLNACSLVGMWSGRASWTAS